MSRISAIVLSSVLGLALVLPACKNGKKQQQELNQAAGLNTAVATSQPSLYVRMGGEATMRAIVDDYVAITSTDPKVNFYRKGTPQEWNPTPDQARMVKEHMVQFFSLLSGDPNASYQGKTLVEVHRGMRITTAQFDASLDDMRTALAKNNIPQDLADEFMQRIDETRKAIVEVKQAQ